ncbi:ribosomal maturation YjgA family protein [Flavobacterium sp.]|uniref:ribosomal maturation YjgA family protein n=1 Tax=Flavobacterium sp. TaxID=239 RepID=UPI002FD8D09C
MFRFNRVYFGLAVALFFIEVAIALFVHDKIVRPYIGDVLVVILIYCFVKSFLNLPVMTTAVCVLLFSYTIEILQYFNLVQKLGLEHNKLARIVIGSSFGWEDFLAYTIGILIVIFVEIIVAKKQLQ